MLMQAHEKASGRGHGKTSRGLRRLALALAGARDLLDNRRHIFGVPANPAFHRGGSPGQWTSAACEAAWPVARPSRRLDGGWPTYHSQSPIHEMYCSAARLSLSGSQLSVDWRMVPAARWKS
jgi:hypothetical protein